MKIVNENDGSNVSSASAGSVVRSLPLGSEHAHSAPLVAYLRVWLGDPALCPQGAFLGAWTWASALPGPGGTFYTLPQSDGAGLGLQL